MFGCKPTQTPPRTEDVNTAQCDSLGQVKWLMFLEEKSKHGLVPGTLSFVITGWSSPLFNRTKGSHQ